MPSVTFETKCWEQDWEALLKTDRLEQMIARNQFAFADRVLIVNNVDHRDEVARHAQAAVDRGLLTTFHFAADYADEALRFFDIERESFGSGYVYSIAELIGIYLCRGDYLLHFSSDSILRRPIDWVTPSIDALTQLPNVAVVNPMWHPDWPAKESCRESPGFYLGNGFSDQCYLVRTAEFRAPIYNHRHPNSERFPKYGGQLFEKRVDAWMLNTERYRLTFKHAWYDHANIRSSNPPANSAPPPPNA